MANGADMFYGVAILVSGIRFEGALRRENLDAIYRSVDEQWSAMLAPQVDVSCRASNTLVNAARFVEEMWAGRFEREQACDQACIGYFYAFALLASFENAASLRGITAWTDAEGTVQFRACETWGEYCRALTMLREFATDDPDRRIALHTDHEPRRTLH